MTRTEICKKNYHELFGGEALPETGNDTEMMAILTKYILERYLLSVILI